MEGVALAKIVSRTQSLQPDQRLQPNHEDSGTITLWRRHSDNGDDAQIMEMVAMLFCFNLVKILGFFKEILNSCVTNGWTDGQTYLIEMHIKRREASLSAIFHFLVHCCICSRCRSCSMLYFLFLKSTIAISALSTPLDFLPVSLLRKTLYVLLHTHLLGFPHKF